MTGIHAVALFCEDVRQEVAGTVTLVGLLSDNLAVTTVPGVMPKLAIYARVQFPVDQKARAITFFLCDNQTKNQIGKFEKDFVEKTVADTKNMGNPLAGFVLTVIASPYPISGEGRHWVEMHYGSDITVIGTLQIVLQSAIQH